MVRREAKVALHTSLVVRADHDTWMSLLSGKSDIKQAGEREASEARDMTLDCCHGSAR